MNLIRATRKPSACTTALSLVCVVMAGLAARSAHADDEPVVAKINELCDDAAENFDAGDYAAAKTAALAAVQLGLKQHLGQDPAVARAYLNLGAIYADGLNDPQKARNNFLLATRIKPGIRPTGKIATAAVKAAFAAAVPQNGAKDAESEALAPPPPKPASRPATAKAKPRQSEDADEEAPAPKRSGKPAQAAVEAAPAPEEPDLPARIPTPLYCPNADEAPPGVAIALRCVAQPGLSVARVLLFYRGSGETFETAATTRSAKGWFNVAIPGSAVAGKSIQYYFEARDASDQVTAHAGRNDSPNLIIVRPGAAPIGQGALAILRFEKGDTAGKLDEDPLAALKQNPGEGSNAPSPWWVAFGAGWGYGWHPARNYEWRTDLLAPAGTHPSGLVAFAPEVGYRLGERWGVALTGRFQFIPSQGTDPAYSGRPARGAQSALVRALYDLSDPARTHLRAAVLVGGGEGFRLVSGNDTVLGGPALAGAGLGAVLPIATYLDLTVDVRALLGIPTFAAVADFNAGVQWRL